MIGDSRCTGSAATVAALLCCAVCVTLAAAQPATQNNRKGRGRMTVPDSVEARTGVVYGTGGGRDLKLDLYLPRNTEASRPAVVFIHGGGWKNGGPGQFRPQSLNLAACGYVCACIEYRLSGEAKFPAALEDAKCAVRWMRASAAELEVDPSRIAVSGGSAGAHLAVMIATTRLGLYEGAGGHAEQSSRANLCIAFNPVLDLAGMARDRHGLPMLEAFLGRTYGEAPELYAQASPITHASKDDPPILILHGTEDTTVPYGQAVAMIGKLTELGVQAELYTAEGAAHAFFNRPPWYQPTVEAMTEFLDRHFRPAPEGQ